MKPMITNGGPHPADKYADIAVDTLMDLLVDGNPDSDTPEAAAARQAKRDLRPVLFAILNEHHDRVQKHERGHLPTKIKGVAAADAHVAAPIDVTPHIGVMDEILAAYAKTPWAAHYAKPEVQEIVKQIVGQSTADAMHIERRYHQDRLNAAAKGA